MSNLERYQGKSNYTINVMILSASQILDLITTKGMVAKHGMWIEANPYKEYLFAQMALTEVLKFIAIPVIIMVAGYLAYKKFPDGREFLTQGMRVLNTLMVCVVLVNGALIVYST